MSLFFSFLRFFPFITIPLILILVEVALFFFRKKGWIQFTFSVLFIVLLIAGNVFFFKQGGFIHFLPWIKSEIDFFMENPSTPWGY
jgi:hypothetical protein